MLQDSPVKVESIDLKEVGSLLNGVHHALIASGQKSDLSSVVKDETRKFAAEVGAPPSSAQRMRIQRSISSDVGKVFIAAPAKPFGRKKRGGDDGVTWLAAGPNFLLGIPTERVLLNKVSTAGGILEKIYRRAFGRLPSRKYSDVGTRGKQHVNFINRFMIGRGAFKSLIAKLSKRVGKRDASFAETADKLGEKSFPSSTTRHFPTGKNTTRTGLLGTETPEIVFGSTAVGVAGLAEKVRRVSSSRARKMAYRIKKILSGYASDVGSGKQISRKADKTNAS